MFCLATSVMFMPWSSTYMKIHDRTSSLKRLWCFLRWFQIGRCLSWATQHKLHLLHLANFSPKRPALPWGRPSLRTSPWVILGQPHHDHHYYHHHHHYYHYHYRQNWSRWRRPWWTLVSPKEFQGWNRFLKCLPIQSLLVPATIVCPIFTISLLFSPSPFSPVASVAMHCSAFCPIV